MSKPIWIRFKEARKRIEGLKDLNQRYENFLKESGLIDLYDDYCETGNVTDIKDLMQQQRDQISNANRMVNVMGMNSQALYEAITARDKTINHLLDMAEAKMTV